ncbi:hypothetical protein L4C36_21845 [Photobacterium japonica]|uniref:hypothetical protein n=1 Tax=Photobacterium japonica TaxID=2910235 RepID=UPI003D0B1326
MKQFWSKVKAFLTTPWGKAYLVFITLTKLYIVYQWALAHVRAFGGQALAWVGLSQHYGEAACAILFTVVCGYYTAKAVMNIFKPKQIVST